MAQCTAKSKQSGERCKRYATPGKDTCKMHGGRPIIHGGRSKYRESMWGDRINQMKANPGELLDLQRQIAILTITQEEFLAKLDREGSISKTSAEHLMKMSEAISKNIERLKRVEEDHQVPKAMQTLVQIVVNVANDAIKDEDDRQRFNASIAQIALPKMPDTGEIIELEGDGA